MKSIFTRPLFINPQAYLTIPELSYIQMATPFDFTEDSYSFVINTSGRIEGKLLKTSNDYILHLDLYSIDGNCVLGEFYLNNSELNTDNFNLTQSKNIITLQFGEQSSGNITYPGLIAAWSAKGKTNYDEDRATLKDLTGNGNDAVAHNFAWSGMSGYGGYPIDFKTEYAPTLKIDRVSGTLTSSKITITSVTKINNFLESNRMEKHKSYKIKVTGVNDDLYIRYFYSTKEYYNIKTEGIHVLPESDKVQFIGFSATKVSDSCNITIELIPEYPGALVFDGVDDYVSLDAFDSGFKTMFMVCKPFKANKMLYDQRSTAAKDDFALYMESADSIAYNDRNKNGTYINNKLSNYKVQYTLNKKQLITVKSELTEIHKPNIGCNQSNSNFFANMKLYKFLGFKEALTEEQIQAVIKKYNLLDGVDEIEVS